MTTLTATITKEIKYNRHTKDYDMLLNGEYVGSEASHHSAEDELDRLAFERLDRAGIEPELLQTATALDGGSNQDEIAAEYAAALDPYAPLGKCRICGAAAWRDAGPNGLLCPSHANVLDEHERIENEALIMASLDSQIEQARDYPPKTIADWRPARAQCERYSTPPARADAPRDAWGEMIPAWLLEPLKPPPSPTCEGDSCHNRAVVSRVHPITAAVTHLCDLCDAARLASQPCVNCDGPHHVQACGEILNKLLDDNAPIEIELTNGKGIALIDKAEYPIISRFKWRLHSHGYAVTRFCNTTLYMHHLVIKAVPAGQVVDHINGNKLDNRRSNLRTAHHRQNAYNSKNRERPGKHSQYRGVTRAHQGGWDRWMAQIRINGKRVHLGYFDDEISAAQAYDAAAREHHGEFAALNFPLNKNDSALMG